MPENMRLYEKLCTTPQEARKPIQGGRLKGFTDINPMWRFKRLTEVFGPCGIGWKYEITRQVVQEGAGVEMAVFVDILLYYKEGDGWSNPIPGIGGSMLVTKESNGPRTNDECFKMALSDAIGTACKALGMSADVYFEKDRTKYNTDPQVDDTPNPLSNAEACVITFGPYNGQCLGEVWKKDLEYIKFLRNNAETPADVKKAIAIINTHARKGR